MSLQLPECPVHGKGGELEAEVARAWVTLGGLTPTKNPRQRFKCRFILRDGSEGSHKFLEGLPRVFKAGAVCPDCGGPVEAWHGGSEVFRNYEITAPPIIDALVSMAAGGIGGSYRSAARQIHRDLGRKPDPNHWRRLARRERLAALRATGDPRDEREAWNAELRHRAQDGPASNLAEWMVEACADAIWEEIGPKEWPADSIVAVDAVKLNLAGKFKYWRRDDEGGWEPVVLHGPDRDLEEDDEVVAVEIEPAEKVERCLDDLLDPDDEEDRVPKLRLVDNDEPPRGTMGGVPCWQVLGAHVYQPDESGRYRDVGKTWLLRSYYLPISLTWAHFFRQLSGTPRYVICDGAHEIRVGVELAWPDPTTRPKVLACEYHVSEVVRKQVEGNPELVVEARRLFQTRGRIVDGDYREFIPNGDPGDKLRLWHFERFLELAEATGFSEFAPRFKTRTWRRFQQQVLGKDDTLKYSIGALEADLFKLATSTLAYRRMSLTNRKRTDRLLMLACLRLRGEATPAIFSQALKHWLIHHGEPYRQQRLIDHGIGNRRAHRASLRTPLSDQDLQAVGLPTRKEWRVWMAERQKRLSAETKRIKYQTDPDFRAVDLERRTKRHQENREAELARMRGRYQRNASQERKGALQRKVKQKAEDPEKYFEQRRQQRRRAHERARKIAIVAGEYLIEPQAARQLLEAHNWDVDVVRVRMGPQRKTAGG